MRYSPQPGNVSSENNNNVGRGEQQQQFTSIEEYINNHELKCKKNKENTTMTTCCNCLIPLKYYQELHAEVETYKIRNDRLKLAFKTTISDFRECVCSLLGWKMDYVPSANSTSSIANISLASIYAFSKEDKLIFIKQNEGEYALYDSPFANNFSKENEIFLKRGRSLPCFLASITMSLWEKSTLSVVKQ